jgi:hypothetical protein
MIRAIHFSVISLAALAALAISILLLVRSFSTDTPLQVAQEEQPTQEQTASVDVPAKEETRSTEDVSSRQDAIAEAFATSQQANTPPDEPFIAKPAGSQRSPYDPLILPPTGQSGGQVTAVAREAGPAPAAKDRALPAGGRLTLSPTQEQRVRYVLQSHNIIQSEVTDFPLRAGNTLPKDVMLSPLPIELASVVPNYRAYSYVFMQDRIVIVSTSSREIGLVLPF